jgi:hypothetical protein
MVTERAIHLLYEMSDRTFQNFREGPIFRCWSHVLCRPRAEDMGLSFRRLRAFAANQS